jgi:uncharacterized protein YodC (DUF2158 family)
MREGTSALATLRGALRWTFPLLLLPASLSAEPRHILFIGNSYTYYHGMPRLTAELAELNGAPKPVVRAVAAGGATLKSHWFDGEARKAIDAGNWHAVVLQESSLQPFIDARKTRQYAASFIERIWHAGAEPVIYLTWARFSSPERQQTLNALYRSIARENGALLVPVGPAWRIALERHPEVRLHEMDDSHPTLAGSCIAAYAFHAVLWNAVAEQPHPDCAEWHDIASQAVRSALEEERLEPGKVAR